MTQQPATKIPSPAEIMRRTADMVAGQPIDFDTLAAGPLGEALTITELRHLADDEDAVRTFVGQVRDAADRLEASGA